MSRLLRLSGWIVGLTIVLAIALLALLRFRPEAGVWAANSLLNDISIEAQNLQIRYFPPSLDIASVKVEMTGQSILATEVRATLDPGAWRLSQPFWVASADKVAIDSTAVAPAEPVNPINLALPEVAPLLSFTRLSLKRLEMTGESALTAELEAEHQADATRISASVEQSGQRYTLSASIGSQQAGSLPIDLRISSDPLAGDVPQSGESTLRAQIAGTLNQTAGSVLRISQGSAQLGQDDALARLDQISGSLSVPASGDSLVLTDFSAYLTSAGAELENLPVAADASINFATDAIHLKTAGRLDQTSFDAVLEIANSTGALEGRFSINSEGLPESIDVSPFSGVDLFPAALAGKFSLLENTLRFQELELETPKNAFSGSASVATAEPWMFVADLNAPRLFLPLVSGTENSASQSTVPAKAGDQTLDETKGPAIEDAPVDTTAPTRLFSDTPIDWAWLNTAEIDAKLVADELALQDAHFKDLKIALINNQGRLSLNPLSANLGDGGFNGSAELVLRPSGTTAAAQTVGLTALFKMSGVSLESFGVVPTEELSGGKVEADLSLTTSGNSAAQLAAGLNGEILLMVEEARLMNDFIELAGSDLIMETLNKLNPFAKEDPTTELSCALVRFTAEDGKLTTRNQLVMETSKMEIVGTGNIDLNDETISLGITPNAKSGVGINIGSAVKFMKLGGTLAAPRPAVSAGGLLKSGLAIGAAISTGGASVVAEGLAKRALNAGSACDAARSKAIKGATENTPEDEQLDTNSPGTSGDPS